MTSFIESEPLSLDTTDYRSFLGSDTQATSKLEALTRRAFEFGAKDRRLQSRDTTERAVKEGRISDGSLISDGFGDEAVWQQLSGKSGTLLSSLAKRMAEQRNLDALHSGDSAKSVIQQWRGIEDESEAERDAYVPPLDVDDESDESGMPDEVDVDDEEPEMSSEENDGSHSESELDEMQKFLNEQYDSKDQELDSLPMDEATRQLLRQDSNDEEQGNEDGRDSDVESEMADRMSELFNLDGFPSADDPLADHSGDESNDEANAAKSSSSLESGQQSKAKKDDDDEDDEFASLSRFEREQRGMAEQIRLIEAESLKDKPWEMQGETGAVVSKRTLVGVARDREMEGPRRRDVGDNDDNDEQQSSVVVEKRPKDAMLESYVDFDYADKLKPVITEEVTAQIEKVLIQRILSDEFDDVQLKMDPSKLIGKSKRKLIEISDRKSSMGLAELYERQYLAQVDEDDNNGANENGEHENNPKGLDSDTLRQHRSISRLKSDLFYSLDLMCRYHYTPKPATIQENVRVKTHASAVYMEEMVPTTSQSGGTNSEMTMAPEEIYAKPKRIVGSSEQNRDERRKKRLNNKKRGKFINEQRSKKDALRAKYDSRFRDHMTRIQALNEVRTHAMSAAKRDGFAISKSGGIGRRMNEDNTKYTSSKQMFGKILESQRKRKFPSKDEGSSGMDTESSAKRIKLVRSHM